MENREKISKKIIATHAILFDIFELSKLDGTESLNEMANLIHNEKE